MEPAIEACGFDNPPPVEVRPTGDWGGWCAADEAAKDGRVCVSSHITFWPKQSIISIYIHESTHRLLCRYPQVLNHGPVFFALNALLVGRCKSFFKLDYQFCELSFFDLQDKPPELVNFPHWQEICIQFARETAAALADKQCSAEHLAAEVVAAWPHFVDKIDQEFKRCENDALKLANFPFISLKYEKRMRELKLWGWTFFAFWLMTFWLPIWMFFKLATR